MNGTGHFSLGHLTQTTHIELLGFKLEQETSKHQVSSPAVSLLWTQDKPEMALSELVFFGWSYDKT